MKLQTKLFLLNASMIITILAVICVAVFLTVYSTFTLGYDISADSINNVKDIMERLAGEYEEVSDSQKTEQYLKMLLEKYETELSSDSKFALHICINNGEEVIYQGSATGIEVRMAQRRARNTSEFNVVIGPNMVLAEKNVGGDNVCFVSSMWMSDTQFVKRLLIIVSCTAVLCLAIFVVFYIIIYVMLVPRLYKLKEALEQIYRGDYDKKLFVKQYNSKDIVGQLVSEFELMRRQLCELTKQKDAFDRQRGEVIAGISHDLKTPLTTIQGYSKGLVDGVATKINKTQEYAMKIYKTAFTMNTLVDKLREFAKRDTDTIIYSFIDRDLNEVVKDFVQKSNIQYMASGLNIKTAYCKEKLICSMDKEQFSRILQNILDNSVKYKEKETGTAQISTFIDKGDAVLIVKDDGPGVVNYELDYIFESYYRGDPSRTNPTSGSGLGLSIVKNIVTAHKGTVVAYNEGGLAIKITIPLRR